MSRENSQKSNNPDKKIKRKKSGFFSVSEDTLNDTTVSKEIDSAYNSNSDDGADEHTEDKSSEIAGKKTLTRKQFLIRVSAFLLVFVGILIAVKFIADTDFMQENKYGLPPEMIGEGTPYSPDIRLPDWETNIFESPEYLELIPDKIRYKVGAEVIYLYKDTISTKGLGMVFLNSYFDAIKRGDHQTVNAMYSSEYLKKDGVSKHGDFPMQKLFDISVELKNGSIEEKEDKSLEKKYDIYYYVVRYKILKNDGMFRNDIDQNYSSAQLIKVLIDSNGKGIIDDIWDIPAYTGDE